MKQNSILMIAFIAALVAIVTVVALKMVGYENPTVIGGGVAGAVAGAISGSLLKKK